MDNKKSPKKYDKLTMKHLKEKFAAAKKEAEQQARWEGRGARGVHWHNSCCSGRDVPSNWE